jgi:hypothetical protein
MKPAPIFLLINGEADGPHEAPELQDKIAARELSPETLSCIEEMPGWRTLPETMLWAYSKLLAHLPGVEGWIHQISEQGLSARKFREDIRQFLQQTKNMESTLVNWQCKQSRDTWNAPVDCLEKVIEVNSLLLRNHTYYQQRSQTWNPGAMDFYPAYKLEAFWEKKFKRNWEADWEKAGGELYDGEMIARLDDQVWARISDFGYPFHPFSFDSSMHMSCVSFHKAKTIGIPDIERPISLPDIRELKFVGL